MKIKYLPKEFVKKGVKYTLLEKNDVFVLYRCDSVEYNYGYYEVFKPRMAKPHPLSGEDYDLVELYPTDEQFGLFGWCCSSEKALSEVILKEFGIDYKVKKDYKIDVSD